MSDQEHQRGVGDPDAFQRLWAPHRLAYILGENKPAGADGDVCPFCAIPSMSDDEGLIVHRGARGLRRAQPLSRTTPAI